MTNLSNLVNDYSFDKYTPNEKFNFICNFEDEQLCNISKQILLIMYSVDEIICKNFKTFYNYYIFDDKSIEDLYYKILIDNETYCINVSKEEITSALIINDVSKFLYRFTCAKKFHIEDVTLKQLRINSWGKDYCRHLLKDKRYSAFYNSCLDSIQRVIDNNISIYTELVGLLYPYDSINSAKVKELNEKLVLKLLS